MSDGAFEARKRSAKSALVEFLSDYQPPRGMDDEQLAKRILFCADAFARKMPVKGDFGDAVQAVLMKIRDTHNSNSWPTQAAFVMAMPAGEVMGGKSPQTYAPDRVERYSQMIEDGEPVPEQVIWGPISSSLRIAAGKLEAYRTASVRNWQEVYRNDARELMAAKYGDLTSMYFKVAAE